MFSGLVQHDLNLNPMPDLAERWEISDNGMVYTFHLVRNATFHDSMPVTSADVKFTIEEAMIPYHPLGKVVWEPLGEIETPDEYTVVFRLNKPFSALLFMLDVGAGGPPVLPKHLYEGTDILNNPYNNKPIGSGPYKFVKWERGKELVMERNENYFREGLPYLDRIIVRTIPDSRAAALALEAGDVDYIPGGFTGLSFSDIARLQDKTGIKVAFAGYEGNGDVLSIVSNLDSPVLGNSKVRQAIAHAIDKQLIIDRVYFGLLKPALTPVSSVLGQAFTDEVRIYEYDPEKARALLDEAGFPVEQDGKRFSVTLYNIAGRPDREKVAEVVREQLRDVGIEVRIVSLELSAYDDIVIRNRDFELALEGWSSGPDPAVSMAQLFHSRQFGVFLGNGAHYVNPQVDQLLDRAIGETNREEKSRLLHDVQRNLAQDLPFIALVEQGLPSAYSTKFAGLPSSPWVPTEPMDRVWQVSAGSDTGSSTQAETPQSSSQIMVTTGIGITIAVAIIATISVVYRRRQPRASQVGKGVRG